MESIFIVFIIFFSFVAIVKIIADYRLRRTLIDKGMVGENIKYLYSTSITFQPLASIKWGMVLIGIGVALLLYQLFPYQVDEQATFGLMFLFAGIGFLVYYFIASRQLKQIEEESE